MRIFLSALALGVCAFTGAFLGTFGPKLFESDRESAPAEPAESPTASETEAAEAEPSTPPTEPEPQPETPSTGNRVFQPTIPRLDELEIQRGVILAEGEIVVSEREIGGVAVIGGRHLGGAIGNGEFKAQGGLGAISAVPSVDRDCRIQGYTLTYMAKRQDPVDSVNTGARYNAKSKRLVAQAKPGDRYFFDNVKIKCAGDTAGRRANSLAFSIR
ncbi:MAG: GldM family protein [Pseudomonadota bacterium]